MAWYCVIPEVENQAGFFDGGDIGGMAFRWETKPPIKEGVYWAFTPGGEYLDEPMIVSVTNIKHLSEPPFFTVWIMGVEYNLDYVKYWLGPLPAPEPPEE